MFPFKLLRADKKSGLSSSLHIHHSTNIQGKVQEMLGETVSFHGFSAVQEEDIPSAVCCNC